MEQKGPLIPGKEFVERQSGNLGDFFDRIREELKSFGSQNEITEFLGPVEQRLRTLITNESIEKEIIIELYEYFYLKFCLYNDDIKYHSLLKFLPKEQQNLAKIVFWAYDLKFFLENKENKPLKDNLSDKKSRKLKLLEEKYKTIIAFYKICTKEVKEGEKTIGQLKKDIDIDIDIDQLKSVNIEYKDDKVIIKFIGGDDGEEILKTLELSEYSEKTISPNEIGDELEKIYETIMIDKEQGEIKELFKDFALSYIEKIYELKKKISELSKKLGTERIEKFKEYYEVYSSESDRIRKIAERKLGKESINPTSLLEEYSLFVEILERIKRNVKLDSGEKVDLKDIVSTTILDLLYELSDENKVLVNIEKYMNLKEMFEPLVFFRKTGLVPTSEMKEIFKFLKETYEKATKEEGDVVIVSIVSPPGIGKSEGTRKILEFLSPQKPPIVISLTKPNMYKLDTETVIGHEEVSAKDLNAFRNYIEGQLKYRQKQYKVIEEIADNFLQDENNKEWIKNYMENNEKDPKEIVKDLIKGILEESKNSDLLKTREELGPLLLAMRNGVPLIIEEWTSADIPPSLWFSVLSYLAMKYHSEVEAAGEKFKIQPGFCVILLSNPLDYAGSIDPEDMNQAFANRIGATLDLSSFYEKKLIPSLYFEKASKIIDEILRDPGNVVKEYKDNETYRILLNQILNSDYLSLLFALFKEESAIFIQEDVKRSVVSEILFFSMFSQMLYKLTTLKEIDALKNYLEEMQIDYEEEIINTLLKNEVFTPRNTFRIFNQWLAGILNNPTDETKSLWQVFKEHLEKYYSSDEKIIKFFIEKLGEEKGFFLENETKIKKFRSYLDLLLFLMGLPGTAKFTTAMSVLELFEYQDFPKQEVSLSEKEIESIKNIIMLLERFLKGIQEFKGNIKWDNLKDNINLVKDLRERINLIKKHLKDLQEKLKGEKPSVIVSYIFSELINTINPIIQNLRKNSDANNKFLQTGEELLQLLKNNFN